MRSRRVVSVGLLMLPSVFASSPALGATDASQSLVVDRSAWSWRHVAPAGLPADEPSQVPPGGLAVAYDGRPDAPAKATYLRLDLSAIPSTAVVGALTLTLPVDPAARSVDPGGVRLVACRLLGEFPTGEAKDPASMPAESCSGAPEGTFDAATMSWSFSLAAAATNWVAGENHGVVIRPAPDYTLPAGAPFQIVFLGAPQVRADLVAAVPAVAAPQPAPQPAPPPVVDPAGSMWVAPPPGLSNGVQPAPIPAPAPVAAPLLPRAAAVAPDALRAAVTLPPPRTSTGALFSLAGLFALLLVAVARAVGNTAAPVAYARAERRQLDRLRRPIALAGLVAIPNQLAQSRQGRRPMSSAASTVT